MSASAGTNGSSEAITRDDNSQVTSVASWNVSSTTVCWCRPCLSVVYCRYWNVQCSAVIWNSSRKYLDVVSS